LQQPSGPLNPTNHVFELLASSNRLAAALMTEGAAINRRTAASGGCSVASEA